MMIFTILKKETLKHIARFTLACMCFNALSLKAEDYTQKIYNYLVQSGEFLQDYESIYDLFNRWFAFSSSENYFQYLTSPTAKYDIFNPQGYQEETRLMTYQQYLDYKNMNSHEGWVIQPNEASINEYFYASNVYNAVANISKGGLGGGGITITNNQTFTLDDFWGVVPIPGDYTYWWSEMIYSLVGGGEGYDDNFRWESYRKLKASRELEQNIDSLTGGGIIGKWNGYGVENWNDINSGPGYEVQQLLKNKGGGSGADLVEGILNDWGLSPREKANLIANAVQAGQRNLLNDLNEKIQKILEDGIKVNNTNEFPTAEGEGGGGGIALPSEFVNALTNLSKDVSNINTQQNERVDTYATSWRGNLGLLMQSATSTETEIKEIYKDELNNISNSLATSKTLLESLFKNEKLTDLESDLNIMIESLAVYQCPQTIVIYKLDNISNWLYQQGLFKISNSIQGKNIEINLDSKIELSNGSLSWRDVCDVFRVIFILFYSLSGFYVFYKFCIFLAGSIVKIIKFVLFGFVNLVRLFK